MSNDVQTTKAQAIVKSVLNHAAIFFYVFALCLANIGYISATAGDYIHLINTPRDNDHEMLRVLLSIFTACGICFNWWVINAIRRTVKRQKEIIWP